MERVSKATVVTQLKSTVLLQDYFPTTCESRMCTRARRGQSHFKFFYISELYHRKRPLGLWYKLSVLNLRKRSRSSRVLRSGRWSGTDGHSRISPQQDSFT